MWLFWAFFSALLAAFRRTQEKQLVHRLNHLTVAFGIQLFALPVPLLAVLHQETIVNPLRLGVSFWLPLIIVCGLLLPLNTYCYLQALRHSDLSRVLPIQSLWPVFSLLPAWFLLGEVPTAISTVGILVTVLGVYILGMKDNVFHHPLQPFREEKGSRYMLLSVLLVTAMGMLDKVAIAASQATYYGFFSSVTSVIVLLAFIGFTRRKTIADVIHHSKKLGVIGLLQGVSYTTYMVAVATGPLAYVAAIRSTNIIIGSLLAIGVLHERLTGYKIISFSLLLLGGTLLVVG